MTTPRPARGAKSEPSGPIGRGLPGRTSGHADARAFEPVDAWTGDEAAFEVSEAPSEPPATPIRRLPSPGPIVHPHTKRVAARPPSTTRRGSKPDAQNADEASAAADSSERPGAATAGTTGHEEPAGPQHVVVLSGLSGAGKTAATKLFEDLGYMCVDNLPGELLREFAALVANDPLRFRKVAVVLDVRTGNTEQALAQVRGALEGRGIRPQVVFLEARDEVLIRRFSETRHRHPLDEGKRGLANSIADERRVLEPIRSQADVVVDTSDLSLRELRERIFTNLSTPLEPDRLAFQLISFGFKFGVPLEADLVFDVRFMTNPYYVPELRQLSGRTEAVRAFVLDQEPARRFLAFVAEFLDFSVPAYIAEGKTRLTIAIGCTGGYHRSIVIAEEMATWLRERGFGPVSVFHRELERT